MLIWRLSLTLSLVVIYRGANNFDVVFRDEIFYLVTSALVFVISNDLLGQAKTKYNALPNELNNLILPYHSQGFGLNPFGEVISDD